MGNAESGPIVRNADKRSSRREHRAIFEAAAERFRAAPFEAPDGTAHGGGAAGRGVRVCVRKRPIFEHEIEQGEFDAITCMEGRVVVHDARMHPDMVKLFMNHYDFAFDETFGEVANNVEVYQGTARQLVLDSLQGKSGTVMMYGQTGSGKTYTMRSVYEQAAEDIFLGAQGRSVTVSFIELFGENCFDMLNQGAPCQLTTGQDGSVHPFPCVEVEVVSPAELLALIDLAGKLRATAATGVHDQSSRSHASLGST
ncbi:Diatom spindle kinesin-1, partial [Durusdinium trenchii]